MINAHRYLGVILLGVTAFVPAGFGTQKQAHPQNQTAKPRPYNTWNDDDKQSYNQYVKEHHTGAKAYNDLTPAQQQQYWNWRDKHPVNLGHPDSQVGRENPNGRGVYDSTTDTYHTWDNNEQSAYRQYADQHHIGEKAYNDLTPQQQAGYWNWRSQHPVNLGSPNSEVGKQNPNNPPQQ
jgi:hypothetical protein